MKKKIALTLQNLTLQTLRTSAHYAPPVARYILEKNWFKVSKYRANSDLQNWIAASETIKLSHRGHNHHVYVRTPSADKLRGSVYLIHGWSGRWDQMIRMAQALFDQNYEVISFDLPGHGENFKNSETDLFEMSEFVDTVFNQLNRRTPSVICHSAGFLTLARKLKKNPITLHHVVTINSPARFEYLIENTIEKIGLPINFDKDIWKMIEQRFQINNVHELFRTTDLNQLIDASHILNIHDQHDTEVKYEELAFMKKIWPEALQFSTQNFGHNKILYSDDVIQKVVHFLTNTPL